MSATAWIIALWVAFGATHIGFSSLRLRPRLVAALGERGFLGLYTLVAFTTFVPLIWTYVANRHAGPYLWYLGEIPGARWIAHLGMVVALALIAAGVARRGPAALVPGVAAVAGVHRITRHPVFMGIGMFGLLHLLVVLVYASDLAFFAGFPIFSLLGAAHQDHRKLAGGDERFRTFCRDTPFLPFSRRGGILAGLREDATPVLVGLCLAAALRLAHRWLLAG